MYVTIIIKVPSRVPKKIVHIKKMDVISERKKKIKL